MRSDALGPRGTHGHPMSPTARDYPGADVSVVELSHHVVELVEFLDEPLKQRN